jgi:hypothetical protein
MHSNSNQFRDELLTIAKQTDLITNMLREEAESESAISQEVSDRLQEATSYAEETHEALRDIVLRASAK